MLRSLAPFDYVWVQTEQDKFEASYTRQLEETGADRILSDPKRIAGGHLACLLCWERLAGPGEYCHRRTLAGFLEREAGIVVPELTSGMLPERPDVPAPRLF